MPTDTPSPAAEGWGGKLPDEIRIAIEALEDAAIEHSREASEGISGSALHRARTAWDDARIALEAAILGHLGAGREALSREKADER